MPAMRYRWYANPQSRQSNSPRSVHNCACASSLTGERSFTVYELLHGISGLSGSFRCRRRTLAVTQLVHACSNQTSKRAKPRRRIHAYTCMCMVNMANASGQAESVQRLLAANHINVHLYCSSREIYRGISGPSPALDERCRYGRYVHVSVQ